MIRTSGDDVGHLAAPSQRRLAMLLQGINHVAVLTNDTDRLHAFYREVFDAEVQEVERNEGMRLSFIRVGPSTMLNVFQFAGNTEADRQVPMFGRGRLDHFGLEAASREAFDEVRGRLIARGATDGFVTDFGPELSLFFRDPDGLEGEVLVQCRPWTTPINPPGTKADGYDVVGAQRAT
jgi:catechol 2,3-dioxygenase-like lactoylglutathione lyase family enzyme